LRIAGTKGVAEYMAATGVTLLSLSRKQPEVIKELPAAEHLFVHWVDHIYNGKPEPITWNDIYRTTHIVLQARAAAEDHKIVKL
jgi:hypothetical protein